MRRNYVNLPLSALVVFTSMAMNIQATGNHNTNTLLQAPDIINSMQREKDKSTSTHFDPQTIVRNKPEKWLCCCLITPIICRSRDNSKYD